MSKNKKRFLLARALGFACVALCVSILSACDADSNDPGDGPNDPEESVVEMLLYRACGGAGKEDRSITLISDEETFEKTLEETVWKSEPESEGDIPEVDFEKYAIVAVIDGYRTNCGTQIDISEPHETDEQVEFRVTIKRCKVAADAIAWPYAFARVPKYDKEVVFHEDILENAECTL